MKFEETTLFTAGIYIYIYIYIYEYICMCKVGTTVQKARERKEDGKIERVEKFFYFFYFTYELQERFICLGG